MRKFTLSLILIAALLLAAVAGAEGILPVLQTPPPEITEAISYHAMTGKDAPTPSVYGDTYCYEYSSIAHAGYTRFGRLLAQEGFALADFETETDGTVNSTVSNGTVELKLSYNQHDSQLSVTYPPRVVAQEADPENPIAVDPAVESILPALVQVPGLTSVAFPSGYRDSVLEDGSSRYYYYNMNYAMYERYSLKLGEEGFTLVSSEVLEDGANRAVVTDGENELTLDYYMDDNHLYITYPPNTCPREKRRYEDYQIAAEGDTLPLQENVTATLSGWEPVAIYTTYYYNDNWIPSKYTDHDYLSEEGVQRVLAYLTVEYNRPEAVATNYLIPNINVYCGDEAIYASYGHMTSAASIDTDSDHTVSGDTTLTFAVGFGLTEAQLEYMDQIVITFSDRNNCVPYAWYLQSPEA